MDAILNFDIRPMNLLVRLLNLNNPQPLVIWEVIHAWPKKWSISDLNAEQNSLAIESLELNYSYFQKQK